MHEFSLAVNIKDSVISSLKTYQYSKIDEIILEIGQLAAVETDALLFAFDSIKSGSILENTTITIHNIDGLAICKNCGHKFNISAIYDLCPLCNDFNTSIIQGMEMKIKSITFT